MRQPVDEPRPLRRRSPDPNSRPSGHAARRPGTELRRLGSRRRGRARHLDVVPGTADGQRRRRRQPRRRLGQRSLSTAQFGVAAGRAPTPRRWQRRGRAARRPTRLRCTAGWDQPAGNDGRTPAAATRTTAALTALPPGDENNNVVTNTVERLVEVVPDWSSRPDRAGRAVTLLGLGYLLAALRKRRLTRQRRELLQEVGLLPDRAAAPGAGPGRRAAHLGGLPAGGRSRSRRRLLRRPAADRRPRRVSSSVTCPAGRGALARCRLHALHAAGLPRGRAWGRASRSRSPAA